ncbi:hypothetical protein TNCV_986891 [Trichonephila clavipes]|nr:hypothetical protein TNCV_986891 [Trichonephila clavipes]
MHITILSDAAAHAVPISVFVTFGAEVHEQMFRPKRDPQCEPSSTRAKELGAFHPGRAAFNPHRPVLQKHLRYPPFTLSGVILSPRVLELVSVHL